MTGEATSQSFLPVTVRPYHDRADLHAMQDLVADEWKIAKPLVQTHVGDLSWWMVSNTDRSGTWAVRLWNHLNGDLLGWAWYNAPDELDMFFHPEFRGSKLHEQAVIWAMHHAAESCPEGPLALRTWVLDTDGASLALLRRLGFSETGSSLNHMVIDLSERTIDDPPPDGFTARAVLYEELRERVDVHRAAYAPSRYSIEKHWRLRTSRGFHPELDVVIAADTGELAAFCLSWLDRENRVGELEPVGTHPEWRRRGLARAAVCESLRRLQKLGADTAVVYAFSTRSDAIGLYESVGFRTIGHHVQLATTIR